MTSSYTVFQVRSLLTEHRVLARSQAAVLAAVFTSELTTSLAMDCCRRAAAPEPETPAVALAVASALNWTPSKSFYSIILLFLLFLAVKYVQKAEMGFRGKLQQQLLGQYGAMDT